MGTYTGQVIDPGTANNQQRKVTIVTPLGPPVMAIFKVFVKEFMVCFQQGQDGTALSCLGGTAPIRMSEILAESQN